MRRARLGVWIGLTVYGAVSCASPADQAEIVLDCSEGPEGQILRLRPTTGIAQDLSFTPERIGTVTITESSYSVKIPDPLTKWELRFSINRFTWDAKRQLFDDKGEPDFGKGSLSVVTCKPIQRPAA
jgi:hypothetical protein